MEEIKISSEENRFEKLFSYLKKHKLLTLALLEFVSPHYGNMRYFISLCQ